MGGSVGRAGGRPLLEKSQNPDEAAIYYGRIAQGFPSSKLFEEATNRLKNLAKPVPPVDTQQAALHEPKAKEGDGFSPLKPFISFATALGFKGPPDRYEEARKAAEANKAEVLAQASKQAEQEGASGDILIQTTLRKDAFGKTQETTVLGAGQGTEQPAVDAGQEKKQAAKKSTKKTDKNP